MFCSLIKDTIAAMAAPPNMIAILLTSSGVASGVLFHF